ncbi:MAG: hypothetical protein NC912_02580, partial [Candidatus Omnitrophica bacterium]|nr:hypothetical protein [Candidatus Omnitrophota bacterium]
MNKDEVLIDFLKGLRVAINNATVYFKEHPYYINSVKALKQKIDALHHFMSPIQINVTPQSLFVDGRYWEKSSWFVELAQIFHYRKIKSICINKEVSVEELIEFLTKVALPAREILRQGGINRLLNQYPHPHILIDELDYSQLLTSEGEEVKDIWVYLFKEVAEKGIDHQIKELVDNFREIITKFKIKDLIEDEGVRKNLYNFLSYLNEKKKEDFIRCIQILFRYIGRHKDLTDKEINKMGLFFKDLNEKEFANLLWQEILDNEDFDILTLNLFIKLAGEEKNKEISSSLTQELSQKQGLSKNYETGKRIRDLLSEPRIKFISETYQHALRLILKHISFEEKIFFDRDLIKANYRLILLNLLNLEKDKQRIDLILERLLNEWTEISKERDLRYLKNLWGVLKKIKNEGFVDSTRFKDLDKRFCEFIENTVWEENLTPEFIYFVDSLDKISFDMDFYLDKIFVKKILTPYGLRLFLRFFSQDLTRFYQHLAQRRYEIEFLGRIIETLKMNDLPVSLEVLKYIFSISDKLIKVEVLKAMQELTQIDKEFLLSILDTKDIFLKKEALAILIKIDQIKDEIIKRFINIASPLGIRNKIILQNLEIIEELRLIEAID